MATDLNEANPNLDRLNENLAKVEDLSQRLVAALSKKRAIDPALQGPSQELYMKAASAYVAEMMANPSKLIEQQVGYWGQTLSHYIEAQKALAEGKAPSDPTPSDKRFSSEMWQTNPWFNFLKQQYLMNAELVTGAVVRTGGAGRPRAASGSSTSPARSST